jgi:hypothetical protein
MTGASVRDQKGKMMSIFMLMLASQLGSAGAQPAPACRTTQLRLSLDGHQGDFNGMSHSGTELSIRNIGPDCTLPALPKVEFRDARGRLLPAERKAPIGMHPGPVMVPVRLAAGHRAATELRWVSGAVFSHSRVVRAASVTVRVGTAMLHAPLTAMLYGTAGKPVTFDQTPIRAIEGMAAG